MLVSTTIEEDSSDHIKDTDRPGAGMPPVDLAAAQEKAASFMGKPAEH